LHEIEGARRRLAFQFVQIHVQTILCRAPPLSSGPI
jgi:hypothetical protein